MNLDIENQYAGKIIAGIDEAGRGPLAGPVVAAAVIVDQDHIIEGINDSKKIGIKKRVQLYDQIVDNYQYAVGIVSPEEIDEINILQATIKACQEAESSLNAPSDVVLVDGNMKFSDGRFKSIVKGDSKSISIAAASIVAKVTRDRIMQKLHIQYPQYNWQKNSGYGTKEHIAAIAKHGFTEHHRRSFRVKI
ncbi:MAG: hypothetical protein DGJ47_000289 [Rickettsiaceae bacterium]